jgi:hypothetical protein
MMHTAKELKAMTLAQLAAVGEPLELTFTKNHTRAERAKRILAAYATREVDEGPRQPAGPVPDAAPSTHAQVLGEPRPEFERLIDTGSLDVEGDSQTPPHGGARPGAGRPEGSTAEVCLYDRLPAQPHPAIRQGIEKLFDAWARKTQCPEVRLSKEEAVALALSWTHVYEISPAKGVIPPWATILFTCLWTTYFILDGRAAMARHARETRRQVTSLVVQRPASEADEGISTWTDRQRAAVNDLLSRENPN